jgi:hypothetical protein
VPLSLRKLLAVPLSVILLIGLAITVAILRAVPAYAADYSGPGPAVGADGNGNEYVFWKGTGNNQLFQSYFNGSWHGPQEIKGMGPLGSEPAVAISGLAHSGPYFYQYVFWKGTDGHLWYAVWSGAWHGPYDLGMGTLGSGPSATSNGQGDVIVAWQGGDNDLWSTYSNDPTDPSSWSKASNAGQGPLGSRPSLGYTDLDIHTSQAWWEGSGNRGLWYGLTSGGKPKELSGTAPMGSEPSSTVIGNLGEAPAPTEIFWEGSAGAPTLWADEFDPENGSSSGPFEPDRAFGDLGSAPSGAFFSPDEYIVFWFGRNDIMYEGYFNEGTWSLHSFPSWGNVG